MSQDNEADSTVTPKYTRYRSVRQAAAKESILATDAPAAPEQNDSIKRSMSRYRRPRAVSKAEQPTSPPLTAMPVVPAIPLPQLNQSASYDGPTRRATEPSRHTSEPRAAAGTRETEAQRKQREMAEVRAREEEQRILIQTVEETLAEQKRKDLERLEATLDAAVQGAGGTGPGSNAPSPPKEKEKFGFFSRKRAKTKTAAPPPASINVQAFNVGGSSSAGPSSAPVAPSGGSNDIPRRSNDPQVPQAVGQGGTGIVPGTDAPISAVNSGERRVLVRHKQSSINLPINPGTTALDIFYSAANIMSHNVAPAAAVLLESYTQLGLERRVRRYEHIRNIMNSWDRDTQNALMLQNSDSPKFDTDLESASVPKEPPSTTTVYMYHSKKPSRWQKCYITLMPSGQMYMSKKAEAKSTDKDIVNLCHMSDFDIYSVIPSQLRKLKTPKKHCYAVKSQQKSTMFLNTENFVHFFSTDDELLANKWYGAVQRWRSWYLVHKKGECGDAAKLAKTVKKDPRPTTAIPGAKAAPTQAGEEKPYLIGSFQPLFNAKKTPQADDYDSEEENRPLQIPFHLRNSYRNSSAPNDRDTTKRHPPTVAYRLPRNAEEEFNSSGLLGRTYSQRLQAQREREIQGQDAMASFSDAPSLLNNGGSSGSGGGAVQANRRSLSTRSTRTSRPPPITADGVLGGQKPLLDFTPQFKEAPQWDKSGKGKGVAVPEGVPLVQVATTMESAVGDIVPKTTIFTRDAAAAARPRAASGSKISAGDSGIAGGSIMNRAMAG